jgi:hypothetical protein
MAMIDVPVATAMLVSTTGRASLILRCEQVIPTLQGQAIPFAGRSPFMTFRALRVIAPPSALVGSITRWH